MNWTTMVLGDLFDVGSSKRVLQSQWTTEGVPFYRGREITRLAAEGFVENELFVSEELYREYSTRYGSPSADDIMVTAIGTIGNSYVVRAGDRFYFKDASVLWLKRRGAVDSHFVNYWLKSAHMKRQLDVGNGATVDTLTIQKLKSLKITVPPIAEQKRIVAILDEAFDGIAKAAANAERNLANARELVISRIKQLLTPELDWEVQPIENCIRLRSGDFLPAKAMDGSGVIPVYGGNGVAGSHTAHNLTGSNIIIGRVGAKCGNVRYIDQPIWLTDNAFVVSEYIRPFDLQFLALLLETANLRHLAKQAAQPVISYSGIKSFVLAFPSDEARQQELFYHASAIQEHCTALGGLYAQRSEQLNELRRALLHKAFSGQLIGQEAIAA